MKGFLTAVPLDEVDWEDRTYAIRSFKPFARLESFLEKFGLLDPPRVLHKGPKRYVVVDGFKRFQWAGRNGFESIECMVFPEETDARDLLLMRLEGKLLGAPPNVAEKAQIISKLRKLLPPEQVVREYFPLLQVAAKPEALEEWCRLAEAGDELLEAVACEEIFDRTALELMRWEEDVRPEMLLLFKELRCSASVQMEILERITEVALRQGRKRADVLHDPPVQSIIADPNQNHRRKTQVLRDLLTRLRFPRLQAREERFERQLQGLSLPKAMRLIHPSTFEGERWQLQLAFSRPKELQEAVEKARDLALSPALESLMFPDTLVE